MVGYDRNGSTVHMLTILIQYVISIFHSSDAQNDANGKSLFINYLVLLCG